MGSDARQRLAGAALVNATWWSAATGLYPTRALRQVGLVGDPPLHGERTASVAASGPRSALLGPGVDSRALDQPTGHEPLIEEFDRMAEVYELFVAPLSRPIFEEVLAVLRPGWRRTPVRWTPPAVRVVSSARSHNSSHTGEVVGVDLAAGMVAAAARAWHATVWTTPPTSRPTSVSCPTSSTAVSTWCTACSPITTFPIRPPPPPERSAASAQAACTR
jgi:hypothetical protein